MQIINVGTIDGTTDSKALSKLSQVFSHFTLQLTTSRGSHGKVGSRSYRHDTIILREIVGAIFIHQVGMYI